MVGQSPPSRHCSRGRGRGQGQTAQPPQHKPIHMSSNIFPRPPLLVSSQNPGFLLPVNPFLQNPTTFPQIQQQFPYSNFPYPTISDNRNFPYQTISENSNFQAPTNNGSSYSESIHRHVKKQKETLEKIDKVAMMARKDLVKSNENVSACKVSEATLLKVKAESWESLGLQMQQVPSLNHLLAVEGKINTFIHCFVAVRRITSLYDLEVAICKNEGVHLFEDLELGPLLRHPLVAHYFSVSSEMTEVCRINTEEIIFYLCEFIDSHKKKKIKADVFLDFISTKRSITGREKLSVRIQDFGAYVDHIKQAKQSEDRVLEKCYEKINRKYSKRNNKRSLFSTQKKELDDHFTSISQRMKTFSSANTQFCGEHTRFASSSSDDSGSTGSDDDDNEANEIGSNQNERNTTGNCNLSLPNLKSDRVSGCPYPSATEEMTRLGLRNEVESSPLTPAVGVRSNADIELSRRKRRYENISYSTSLPNKMCKSERINEDLKNTGSSNRDSDSHSISSESLKMFFTTWKEACRVNTADEVLGRMLEFYNVRRQKRARKFFKFHPFRGLLHAAVTFIKFGMSDHMYDTFQTLSQQDVGEKPFENSPDYISIDVGQAKKDIAISTKLLTHEHNVRVEDIAKKISEYLENDSLCYISTSPQSNLRLFKTLWQCENWLIEQYDIEKFEFLGYGEYLVFLYKYMHLLPQALQKCIQIDTSENVSLEAHLLPIQLEVLLSQALDSLRGNESINFLNVSELLAKQFPSVCFKLGNDDLTANCPDILREKRPSLSSSSLLFSIPLSRSNCVCDSAAQNERVKESSELANHTATVERASAAFSTKNVVEAILKAPMMIDLNMWLHWDIFYAPSLGSIVEWMLKEVNTKDLLCLITKDGKVIRIDHSSTVDSFLKVLIRGSSSETAVQLLSLIALYGGKQNVPQSLLKCLAHQGFEVMINNYLLMELHNDKNPPIHGNLSSDQHTAGESTSGDRISKTSNNRRIMNKAAPVMARFVLECLSYLPIEFCSFAADILIAGLRSFITNVPAAVLSECNQIEQRLMLHEVGMSLGLMEWVEDYQSFSTSWTGFSYDLSSLDIANPELNKISMIGQGELGKNLSSCGMLVSCDERASDGSDSANVSHECQAKCSVYQLTFSNLTGNDPARIIESIRSEEFGLHTGLSAVENNMLEKQHARLGRALHCLSQELYSQDSHFLLELVQNADDNSYPQNVEPTLIFILREEGIIVLNNEEGFSAKNIKALCDVGNSTKKGNSAGYIGKKGLGFKSVFRVTDAPEIHSNGFHIKFDITEGQIGFVLPTVVSPCDIDLYTRLVAADDEQMNQNSWNTCIVLPFRSNTVEGIAMNHISSMFSDLHPSLLLFLHRLQCIKFRNLIDHSLIVMRRKVIGDGIVEVDLGNTKMTWFVVSQKLKADSIRPDVQTTEISIAFTLHEKCEGGYTPILDQQPVFAFLPLRTYGLKFILQGDFVLPSSREEVDGNSTWNQWLLSKFPDLFVSAERSFCALPCYRGSRGKAITVFMSFLPLMGEVHGFFSSLPRMIISKLRMLDCLILDGDQIEWVPPCKVLRNWTEQSRALLPDSLLHEHLGLGFLNKDIVLSDSLANALGVQEYGPKVLLGVMSSLCRSDNGLKSLGLSWLSSWLSTIYAMSSQFLMQTSPCVLSESNLILNLQKTPFIPLSDGTYSSLDEGTIWLHSQPVSLDINDECLLKAFPKLFTKLRIVSPDLLATAMSSCSDTTIMENVTRMLYKVGVQKLSVHDVVKVQILPAISNEKNATGQKELMIEYLTFAMFHLQSSCSTCTLERAGIIAGLHEKALVLTNYGFKRSSEVPIHFSQEFDNPIDMSRLTAGMDMKWYEIDAAYVKHSITKSISGGVLKWRNFLNELGITDFVQVVQVEKSVTDISLANSEDFVHIKDTVSTDLISKDWESEELFQLLSWVSSNDDREKSEYLLEVLDRLWNDYFSDKVTGYYISCSGVRKPFKSSLLTILQDIPWVASNINNKLCNPKDLFHDCVAVNSVLGGNAPYTIPKVVSEELLVDIGFRTQVTLDDAISILKLWRKLEAPLNASLLQMSNFYSFLCKEMAHSKKEVSKELCSEPFIFVPITFSSKKAAVPGALLSSHEVYWNDIIDIVYQTMSVHPEGAASIVGRQSIMLCNFYPDLHDFFVNECGVDVNPPLCSYLQILLQLSTTALPHQAAKRVYEVFVLWGNALKSGSLSFEDVDYLKESLLQEKYAILPTTQDKWVSLHPSYGMICWCDDDDLGKEFRHIHGVEFLHLGESTDEEKQMLQEKISTILQRLGIPALSKIVTRESICYGPSDCSYIFSLVNWVLPYAQRYMRNVYPDKYSELKQSGFEILRRTKIVVVENLFFRNVIKKCGLKSKKRHQCNCLVEDTTLYCTRELDPHAIYLELSHLLLDEAPDLHFANFLHMITTMAQSGATKEQVEFFILKSQRVPIIPTEEPTWSLPTTETPPPPPKSMFPMSTTTATAATTTTAAATTATTNEVEAEALETSSPPPTTNQVEVEALVPEQLLLPDARNHTQAPGVQEQAWRTGRLGEQLAFEYFVGIFGEGAVNWVNEKNETGLPYDIVVQGPGQGDEGKEYVEVKATKSCRKNWFLISMREWQFAVEKGESFSIAHVVIADNSSDMARVTVYKNPARLCQLRSLRLAVLFPQE